MNRFINKLKKILPESDLFAEEEIIKYALESYAKEVDFSVLNVLLKKLVLDQAEVSKNLDNLNKELEFSREVLLEAQKIAMIGRWDYDIENNHVIWSRSVFDILDIDSKTTESLDIYLDKVHHDDYYKVKQFLSDILIVMEPLIIDHRVVTETNNIRWVQVRSNFSLDENNKITKCFGTIQDITEMKIAEEKLEKYNSKLEKLVEEKILEISDSQMATIFALIKLAESRDDSTGDHVERTADFCRLLAQKAALNPKFNKIINDAFIITIYKASPLHDIGKVGIPDNILLKPGKLSVEEYEIMKTHVKIGYETLAKIGGLYSKNEFLKMGMEITLYHHEKWDGSGYPAGIAGDKIPISARIMAIADVYDALRSKRIYKEGYSHQKSLDIISSLKGTQFDPDLTDVFIHSNAFFDGLYKI